MSYMKQIILIRKDLKMNRGKEIAQGAHASMKATLENMDHPCVVEWLAGSFTKIAVSVSDENELKNIVDSAKDHDIITAMIIDNGRTQFKGIHTLTAAAIGPGPSDIIDKITGHLKLR